MAAASRRLQTPRALVSTLARCPRAMVLVRDGSHSTARAPGQVHSAVSRPHAQPQDRHFFPLKCCNEAAPQCILSLFSPTSSAFCIFQRKKSSHGCCLTQCLNCLVMNKDGPEALDKPLLCIWTALLNTQARPLHMPALCHQSHFWCVTRQQPLVEWPAGEGPNHVCRFSKGARV